MPVTASFLSPSFSGYTPGQGAATPGGAAQGTGDVPVGLRGSVSLGSGLRTGVTVVERAIQTSAELQEARERAREALQEQRELERRSAETERAANRQDSQTEARPAETAPPTTASAPQDDDTGSETIVAAVAAGEAGQEAPRGAFVDFSV